MKKKKLQLSTLRGRRPRKQSRRKEGMLKGLSQRRRWDFYYSAIISSIMHRPICAKQEKWLDKTSKHFIGLFLTQGVYLLTQGVNFRVSFFLEVLQLLSMLICFLDIRLLFLTNQFLSCSYFPERSPTVSGEWPWFLFGLKKDCIDWQHFLALFRWNLTVIRI